VIGIAAITAALIILLSAFNGIEMMIDRLYSEFDSEITIRPKEGKTFNENQITAKDFLDIPGVIRYSRVVEEVVILKHEKKWVNANLIGVDSSFLQMANMKDHMVDGGTFLKLEGEDYGLIGATLLDKLGGFIPQNLGFETLTCYVPKRDIKIRFGKNPFSMQLIKIAGRINYNREVNAQQIIVPIGMSRNLMGYTNQLSAYYIECNRKMDREVIKSKVQNLVGKDFVVKTNYEKNELIYKTSKSEKLIVLIILLFIFILAAFNLVASLTMLFVEKLADIKTMIGYGANSRFIFKIFFFEGLLISAKGILIGAVLGYLVCILQINFEFITMPNSGGEAFPMKLSFWDGTLILSLVVLLSVLFSYLPVKFLIHNNLKK
jgi:lipoprotein-releasing system permease protein